MEWFSSTCLPYALYTGVAALLAWSQKDKLASALKWLKPAPMPVPKPSVTSLAPAERFELYYRLRTWCKTEGHKAAVTVLDDEVLPAIVKEGKS